MCQACSLMQRRGVCRCDVRAQKGENNCLQILRFPKGPAQRAGTPRKQDWKRQVMKWVRSNLRGRRTEGGPGHGGPRPAGGQLHPQPKGIRSACVGARAAQVATSRLPHRAGAGAVGVQAGARAGGAMGEVLKTWGGDDGGKRGVGASPRQGPQGRALPLAEHGKGCCCQGENSTMIHTPNAGASAGAGWLGCRPGSPGRAAGAHMPIRIWRCCCDRPAMGCSVWPYGFCTARALAERLSTALQPGSEGGEGRAAGRAGGQRHSE